MSFVDSLAHATRETLSTSEEKEMRKKLSNSTHICIVTCVALAALALLATIAYPSIPTAIFAGMAIVICYDIGRVCYNIKKITDNAREDFKQSYKRPEKLADYLVSDTIIARLFSGAIAKGLAKS